MPIIQQQRLTKYEIRFGDLFWGDRHIANGTGAFAVILINDGEFTNILKHGELRSVQAYAKTLTNTYAKMPPEFRYDCETLILPVHPEIIEEINACLETTGRAKNLKAFLAFLHEKHPDIALHPLALTP